MMVIACDFRMAGEFLPLHLTPFSCPPPRIVFFAWLVPCFSDYFLSRLGLRLVTKPVPASEWWEVQELD